MLIAVSVSHKTAPVEIRELFAFTQKKQVKIINDIVNKNIASECVLLATCNRTEFYCVTEDIAYDDFVEELMLYLATYIDNRFFNQDLQKHINIYFHKNAVEHLFLVSAGLDSMVIGEDQILGQVKNAHQLAMENHTTNAYVNTLFRLAITSAKKVKTDTELSKTPISIATLATKATIDFLGTAEKKNVMVIGASGRLGNIVLKDLQSYNNINIIATNRHHIAEFSESYSDVMVIDYLNRYDFINQMDAIISATSSPHFTIEADKIQKILNTSKKRIFIDLAVPKDIEVYDNKIIKYLDIDDFEEIARNNNKIKRLEAEKAKSILNEYIKRFYDWQVYKQRSF